MRYGIVRDGIVINVVSWDGVSEWSPPIGCELVRHDEVDIGDLWDGCKLTKFYDVDKSNAPT